MGTAFQIAATRGSTYQAAEVLVHRGSPSRAEAVPGTSHPDLRVAGQCNHSLRRTCPIERCSLMKILFLMHSMAVGGTQRQLIVLCRELQRRGHEVTVLLHYTGELLDAELQERGVRIIDLNKRGRWHNFAFLIRLIQAVRAEQPDVVYAHLPLPNLLALLLRY